MRVRKLIILSVVSIFFASGIKAQDLDALGTYTPYSLYGIGSLEQTGSSITRGMGGIGTGVRSNKFINIKNIASITERDTLAFMLDFGLNIKNYYIKDANSKSAHNTANINNMTVTVPIYRKSAVLLGIQPYSSVGYKFETKETNPELVSEYGDISYQKYGNGSINEVFIGYAANISKNLSVGVQGIYYFGDLTKHSDINFNTEASIRAIETGWNFKPTGFSAEFGLQYFKKFEGDYELTVGGTYRLKNKLNGSHLRYSYAYDAAVTDTISYEKRNFDISIPGKFSVGASLKKEEKWMVGFDYEHQDWSKANFRETPGLGYTSQAENSYRLGVEYTPNRYDIRYYYRRISYRVGAYYNQSYVKFNGQSVNCMGITLGASLPVFRWNNSFNVAVDFGQRGKTGNNLVKERYVNFIISLNLYDLWFVKQRYQ